MERARPQLGPAPSALAASHVELGAAADLLSPPAAICLPRPTIRGTPIASTPLAAIALACLGSAPKWNLHTRNPAPCAFCR